MRIVPSRYCRQLRRSGTTAVEAAVAYSVLFLMLIGLLVGGLGVFRYQEVASLAREASRYASVRGKQYEIEVPGATAATKENIYENVIKPRAINLDLSKLRYDVDWNESNATVRVESDGTVVGNTVTVIITYEWVPEFAFVGPITLSSSSTLPMSY